VQTLFAIGINLMNSDCGGDAVTLGLAKDVLRLLISS
jgi:hypothetical protein